MRCIGVCKAYISLLENSHLYQRQWVRRISTEVFRSVSTNPFENLAFEDWIYETMDFKAKRVLYLWRNEATVVIGRHQNPWKECNLELIKADKIHLARRKSGGGTVYHDLGNINLTFFTNRSLYNRRDNLSFVAQFLKDCYNLKASVNERDDLVLNINQKISGTAAKLGLKKAYHHCTLLCQVDLERLNFSLVSKGAGINSNATASVKSETRNLFEENLFDWREFSDRLGNYFLEVNSGNCFENQGILDVDPSTRDHAEMVKNIKSELIHWDWVFGKTPKFNLEIEKRFTFGQIKLNMIINKGIIQDIVFDMAENTCEGKEADFTNHWGSFIYQFDDTYAAEVTEHNKAWMQADVIPRISKLLDSLDTYKILAIGSGTGYADRTVLELIAEYLASKQIKGPKILYTIVEPDKEANEVCKKVLGEVSGLDIEFSWEAIPMQEYFSREHSEQFEMIHFIHSLCQVSRCAKVFPEILRKNYVRHDGVLFSVLGDKDKNFYIHLYLANIDKLKPQGDDNHHHHNHDDENHEPHLRNIVKGSDVKSLEEVIKNESWQFKMFVNPIKQYVTDILERTPKGLQKLGFKLETRNIEKQLPKEHIDDIIKQIDDAAVKKIVDGKEIRFVETINHIVIVYHD
eukprot:gene5527-6212_t